MAELEDALTLLLEAATSEWAKRTRKLPKVTSKLTKATQRYFRKQLQFVLDEVLPKAKSDFEEAKKPPATSGKAVEKLNDYQDQAWNDAVEAAITRAAELGIAVGTADVGFALSFDARKQVITDYLQDHSAELLADDVTEYTKQRLRDVLASGYEEKKTFAGIVDDVQALYDGFVKKRAETIAVTEIGNAFTEGTKGVAKSLQAEGKQVEKSWLAEADACPICDDNANDGWIPMDENFSSGDDAPLAHPLCRCALLTRVAGT